jgi:hypothetical protein
MRSKMALLLLAVTLVGMAGDRSDACGRWRRCRPCYGPAAVCVAPQPVPSARRVRVYLEGDVAEDDLDDVRVRPPVPRAAARVTPSNVTVPAADIFEGAHRVTPKTTIVHGGDTEAFADVNALIAYFESPLRVQEQWWGTVIKKTTEERNAEIELVNVTVQDAWIYEISRQGDHDYHLLIGVHPDQDQGRYVNAEVAGIDPEGPDADALWQVRQSFRQQYETHTGKSLPGGYTQPPSPIHIRVSGSILLDADHGRAAVGHGDIKNFTSWEIHPITSIQILDD